MIVPVVMFFLPFIMNGISAWIKSCSSFSLTYPRSAINALPFKLSIETCLRSSSTASVMSMYSNCCLTNENIAWIFIAGAADSPVFLLRPAPLFGNFPAAPFRNVITLPSIRFMSSTFRIFNSFCSSELTSFLAFFLNFLFTEYIA